MINRANLGPIKLKKMYHDMFVHLLSLLLYRDWLVWSRDSDTPYSFGTPSTKVKALNHGLYPDPQSKYRISVLLWSHRKLCKSEELVESSMAWMETRLFLLNARLRGTIGQRLLSPTLTLTFPGGMWFPWNWYTCSSPLCLKKKKIGTTIPLCQSKGTAPNLHPASRTCINHVTPTLCLQLSFHFCSPSSFPMPLSWIRKALHNH